MICVVHGYRFPMVIQPVAGTEHYRFVEIAYVQGYIHGWRSAQGWGVGGGGVGV